MATTDEPTPTLCDAQISVYKDVKDTIGTTHSFGKIATWIKNGSGEFADTVASVRAAETKDARTGLKLTLPGATFCGEFSRRKRDNLTKHSGLLCLDFDDVEDLVAKKEALSKDDHVVMAFVSPSGTGLKVILRVPDGVDHDHVFDECARYLKHYELEADRAASDVSRLCFLSHDPDAIINFDAEELPIMPPEIEQKMRSSVPETGDRIGDRYNACANVRDRSAAILCTLGWKHSKGQYWTRPGKDRGTSGTLFDNGNFYCFTSNAAPLAPGKSYSPFALYAIVKHDGDFKAAALALADEFGDKDAAVNDRDFFGKTAEGEAVESSERKLSLLDRLNAGVISDETRLERLRRNQLEQVEVIPGALLGQATVYYMRYNGGKTLLTFRFIADSVEEGKINGSDVYYILADDDFSGAICKGSVAEEKGFQLVIPSLQENSIDIHEIEPLLDELAETGEAAGKIFIVDTLKKVVSMMDKRVAAKFGKTVRKYIQNGGTFIALGHINKHPDDKGNAVHEGTGDIVNDFDCVYLGDIDTPLDEANRQVTFKKDKSRGDVPLKFSVRYDAGSKTSWRDKFDSVQIIDEAEAEEREKTLQDQRQLDNDFDAVMWIREQLIDGPKVTNAITKAEGKPGGMGWKKIDAVIHKYGDNHRNRFFRFWTSKSAPKNAQLWSLTDNHPEQYFS